MESVIGIRLVIPPTEEGTTFCSGLTAKVLRVLIAEKNVLYQQILYPYADALSLSGRRGTESTGIFGTHTLLRNIDGAAVEEAIARVRETEGCLTPPCEITSFTLTDGSVKSSDVAAFLRCNAGTLAGAGDFSAMLSGYLPHWRIRECARVFASFSEMAYRAAGGCVCGLLGGRLILTRDASPTEAASIFTLKTGCQS